MALALEERGLFGKRGKLRVAWLSKLQTFIRKPRDVDDLQSYLQRQQNVDGVDAAKPWTDTQEEQSNGHG